MEMFHVSGAPASDPTDPPLCTAHTHVPSPPPLAHHPRPCSRTPALVPAHPRLCTAFLPLFWRPRPCAQRPRQALPTQAPPRPCADAAPPPLCPRPLPLFRRPRACARRPSCTVNISQHTVNIQLTTPGFVHSFEKTTISVRLLEKIEF